MIGLTWTGVNNSSLSSFYSLSGDWTPRAINNHPTLPLSIPFRVIDKTAVESRIAALEVWLSIPFRVIDVGRGCPGVAVFKLSIPFRVIAATHILVTYSIKPALANFLFPFG